MDSEDQGNSPYRPRSRTYRPVSPIFSPTSPSYGPTSASMPQDQNQEVEKPRSHSPDGGPAAQSDGLHSTQDEAQDDVPDPQVTIYRVELIRLSSYRHDGRLQECEEGCVELLLKRDLPKDIRVKTLYLMSGLVEPYQSEYCLREAERVLGTMDAIQSQVAREQGEEMLKGYEGSQVEDSKAVDVETRIQKCQQDIAEREQEIQGHQREIERLQGEIQGRVEEINRLRQVGGGGAGGS